MRKLQLRTVACDREKRSNEKYQQHVRREVFRPLPFSSRTVSPCQLVKISSHFKFSIIQWKTFPLAFSSSFLFSFLNIYELEGGLGEGKRECRFNASEYFMQKIFIRKPVIIIFVLLKPFERNETAKIVEINFFYALQEAKKIHLKRTDEVTFLKKLKIAKSCELLIRRWLHFLPTKSRLEVPHASQRRADCHKCHAVRRPEDLPLPNAPFSDAGCRYQQQRWPNSIDWWVINFKFTFRQAFYEVLVRNMSLSGLNSLEAHCWSISAGVHSLSRLSEALKIFYTNFKLSSMLQWSFRLIWLSMAFIFYPCAEYQSSFFNYPFVYFWVVAGVDVIFVKNA